MEITPRWEYRCWTDPAHAQALFDGDWSASAVESRRDTYLIGPHPAFMPKLRNGEKFEIKQLVESREGLELWAPCLSVPLPCGTLPSEPLETADMLLFHKARKSSDFVHIAANAAQWAVVPVEKRRRRFDAGDIRCEVTQVILSQKNYWTFAAETKEFDHLAQLIDTLPLKTLPNVNYRTFIAEHKKVLSPRDIKSA